MKSRKAVATVLQMMKFSMAIHYYDEDTIEVGKPIGGKVVVNHSLQNSRDTQKTRRNTKRNSQAGIGSNTDAD
jgi:hypothetical protein